MQLISKQNVLVATQSNKWIQRVLTTGFMFFLVKGLLWLGAGVWLVYS